MSERVGEGVKKEDDVTVGGDVRDTTAFFHGDKVDIPLVQDKQRVSTRVLPRILLEPRTTTGFCGG